MDRRQLIKFMAKGAVGIAAGAALPASALAQSTPSAAQIQRQLGVSRPVDPSNRVTIRQFKRDRRLRHLAPSIDIHSLNFEFGSSRIPPREYWKVQEIASAIRHLSYRRRGELFLVEGHTDAVGSRQSNYHLSERRARSLADALYRTGVPRGVLETVGYGEEYLLVPTQRAEWRNRRVTLRRITDYIAY